MPKSESLNESGISPARKARDEVQLTLGQIHGVVSLCGNDVNSWLKTPISDEGTEPDLTSDDIRRALAEAHAHFGTVHAALNTGAYDEDLVKVGLSGAQGEAKRKGFLSALGRLFARGAKTSQNYAVRMRSSLRWSGTLIGSLTAALKKEIELVPGAASAGEAIKEIVELILNATEAPEIRETPGPTEKRGQIRGDTVG